MPRYFFSIENHETDNDDEGTELAGPDVARVNAVMYLGEFLRDHPDMIWDGRRMAVMVDDQDGVRIFRIVVEADEP